MKFAVCLLVASLSACASVPPYCDYDSKDQYPGTATVDEWLGYVGVRAPVCARVLARVGYHHKLYSIDMDGKHAIFDNTHPKPGTLLVVVGTYKADTPVEILQVALYPVLPAWKPPDKTQGCMWQDSGSVTQAKGLPEGFPTCVDP